MAIRGRKPKPAELKLMTGNPGRRPIAESVGEFTGALLMPSWIEDKPKPYQAAFIAEWNRITRQLEAWAIVGEVNQGLIEGVSALYAQAIQATTNGEGTEARQSFDAYRKALNEFGLTPASKGRVNSNGKPQKSGALAKYTAG